MSWTAVLEIFVKIMPFLLDKMSASDATRRSYQEFLTHIETDAASSSSLRESAKSQKERLKDKLKG